MNSKLVFCLGLVCAVARFSPAAIIGTNPPSQALTAERIATLTEHRTQWQEYLEFSTRQLQADQDFLQAEMKEHGMAESLVPPSAKSIKGISLNRAAAWYGWTEGRRIADIIVSFQTPAGGWSKNLDMTRHRRAP